MIPNNETTNQKVNLDPQSLSNLGGLPIKDAENQNLTNPVTEGSKQTTEEFGKQVSSQLGSEEEVKQVQSEGQLSISSQKKYAITGKLIFKDQYSHY